MSKHTKTNTYKHTQTFINIECGQANKIFNEKSNEEPWFGIEQEFFLMRSKDDYPVGFDPNIPQGQYYCSVGSRNAYERNLVEKMCEAGITAGLGLSGWNAEVAPGQWEIQIGPVTGIDAGDHLWVLRYIMERVTEGTPYYIELHPKPIVLDNDMKHLEWNGSGAHTNYSTKAMREKDGINVIKNAIDKLSEYHKEHILCYGEFNELRLSGKCETSSMDKFTYGIADRSASVRIPTEVAKNGYGYFEDRRPSSIMDPYKIGRAHV